MLTGVGLGEVIKRVNRTIVWPSRPWWKVSALPTRTSHRLMLSQLWKERKRFPLQRFGPPQQNVVQCLGLENSEQVLKQLTGLLKCVQPSTNPPPSISTTAFLWESLGDVLKSCCCHTGFEEFYSRKGSLKWYLIFYTISYRKITCFFMKRVQILF